MYVSFKKTSNYGNFIILLAAIEKSQAREYTQINGINAF